MNKFNWNIQYHTEKLEETIEQEIGRLYNVEHSDAIIDRMQMLNGAKNELRAIATRIKLAEETK